MCELPVYETVILSISGSGTLTELGFIIRWLVRWQLGKKLVEMCRPEDVPEVTRYVFGRPDPQGTEPVSKASGT